MLTLSSIQGSHETIGEYLSGGDDTPPSVNVEKVVEGVRQAAVSLTIKLVSDPTTGNRRFTIE